MNDHLKLRTAVRDFPMPLIPFSTAVIPACDFSTEKPDPSCHRLTLTNARTGRLEIKKRRYDDLHVLVATAVQ